MNKADRDKQLADFVKGRNFVAYTNSYSIINEGFIENFMDTVGYIIDNGESLNLQNPPATIYDQFNNLYAGDNNFCILKYHYGGWDLDTLKDFHAEYQKQIVGQDSALNRLMPNLYRMYKKRNKKPIIIMLYGASGIGKTETAKLISKTLEGKLMRKQLSMYQNNDAFDYLFGSSHSKGSFAKDLLEREANIILLDEFDKANEVFYSAFYQLFDEGLFEDSNYRVEVGNSLIICTSNFKSEAEIRKAVGDPIYYRFDDLIYFEGLSTASIHIIIEKILDKEFEGLLPEEKEVISYKELLNVYKSNAERFMNFRHIEKIIKNDLYSRLVNELVIKRDEIF
ncbi:ATP-dependent Clp protease ATP-binding subunit [Listeria weihenstephanensis]|uniref:ATP-dependent Clp protease ATP-binding subunit n=1 Tax=Listeria weihenstephanensis TaxID=1006155 RepID=A0A841Z7A5_9LIST|nr:AAA family ATPase [Listeria weihenstephanensis]MBC1501088.1 ATP-dependent Clp protease ATP-binding subunit [Listeria weihenstephanensis]